jgi:hypothetical protein
MHVVWLNLHVRQRLGMPIKYQRLTYAGKTLATGTIEENGITKHSTLTLTRRHVMDGGAKVIKTVLKSKVSSRALPSNREAFAGLHQVLTQVQDAGNLDLKTGFRNMSPEKTKELHEMLDKKDKTSNANKLKNLHTYLHEYETMQLALDVINVQMAKFKTLVEDALDEQFGTDDGTVNFQALKDYVLVCKTRADGAADMDI